LDSTPPHQPTRISRWTWLNIALLILLAPPAVFVGRIHYQQYQLQRKRAELMALYRHGPSHFPVSATGRSGVEQPVYDGQVVLLRKGDAFGAFVPLKQSGHGGGTIEFEWYYRTDASGELDEGSPAVHSGRGIVSGSSPDAVFGPFTLQWSYSTAGWGWLYYDRGSRETVQPDDLRICLTERRSLWGLDAASAHWTYKASRTDSGIAGDFQIAR
jgi:hypothetical protein